MDRTCYKPRGPKKGVDILHTTKLQYLGHVMGGQRYEILQVIIEKNILA